MRDILVTNGGGAIGRLPNGSRPASRSVARAAKSQLEAAGKPALAGPYLDLGRATFLAHQQRYEALGELIGAAFAYLARVMTRSSESSAERYLAQATDLAELERRERRVQRGERRLLA